MTKRLAVLCAVPGVLALVTAASAAAMFDWAGATEPADAARTQDDEAAPAA